MTATAEATPELELVDAEESRELLDAYGIPTPGQALVETPEAAAAAATELGFPAVLKAQGQTIVHKSDVGGVRLDLASADEVLAAAQEMAARIPGVEGFLVQAMAPKGIELIVGGKRDPVFGAAIVVGFGGVWTELLQDVALRIAPVTEAQALEMLSELKAGALLDGYRGAEPCDRAALARIVASTSRLIAEHPEIAELDLNPVLAHPDGAIAVDARLLRAEPEPAPAPREPAGDAEVAEAITRLMRPRSVVVIGASRNPTKQGGRLLHYLVKHGFEGALYAVNPTADEIMGCPSFPSVAELPEAPDLACIVVPAAAVADAVEACGARGVATAIICTAGFAETGEEGASGQEAVLAAARRHGIRLVGPNTNGVVSAPAKLCASFSMSFDRNEDEIPAPAPIALVTHSGALGSSLLGRMWERGVGVSHWISVGNEADIQLGDYVMWLADDPDTKVIALFMESVRDAALLRAACQRAQANGKAVLVYKTGYSDAGRRAVQSHTSALAGDGAVYDAALDQMGAIRVPDLQTLMDAAIALAWLPAARGPRVGVVSASGGACSVIADECARNGLEVPTLSPNVRARVEELIPPFASAQNPIDVTAEVAGSPGMIGNVLEVLHEQDDLDALVVMLTTNAEPGALDVAQGVVRVAATATKPIIVARMGAEFLAPNALALYREAGIPVYPMPDMAIRALKASAQLGAHRQHDQESR